VVPQLSSGWQHNYSAKTRQAGLANEQSMCSLMSMEMQNIIESRETNFTAELYLASSMGEIEIYFNTSQLINQNGEKNHSI